MRFGSTDSGKLFAADEVEHAGKAEGIAEEELAFFVGGRFDGADGAGLGKAGLAEDFGGGWGLFGGEHGDKGALIGDVEGIEAEQFAGGVNGFADRNAFFFEEDIVSGLAG